MSTRILITGGLGYLGGRIARYLARHTDLFICIGTRNASRVERPSWLDNGELVSMDFTSEESMNVACAGASALIHLAALNEIDSQRSPEQAFIVNSLGSLKLLRAACRNNVKRMIYFSTAHVYGAPLVGEISERTIPRPIHPYAITHKAAEDFILASHDRNAIEGVVIRLSNGFGAPERTEVNRWTLLVNDLCRQAVEKRQLTLLSSGLQWRDFITLHDIVRAVHHFMGLNKEQLGDGLFNLGGNCPLRIIDMANRIAVRCERTLGFRPELIRLQANIDAEELMLHYRIEKILATGFALTGDIDAEIDATISLCQHAFGVQQ